MLKLCSDIFFFLISIKTCVVGTQKKNIREDASHEFMVDDGNVHHHRCLHTICSLKQWNLTALQICIPVLLTVQGR